MSSAAAGPVISVMLAVPDAQKATDWYKRALGATELWNHGGVVGLEVEGAPFFLAEPAGNGWDNPEVVGTVTARVELFADNPDAFVARAVQEGAKGSLDSMQNHQRSYGIHRQGGFHDPFGHIWLVGDKSPLRRHVP
jgi:PhnB protein